MVNVDGRGRCFRTDEGGDGEDPGDDAYFDGGADPCSITFLTRASRSFAEPVGPPELLVDIMVQVGRC